MAFFTEEEIRKYAFSAVVDDGKKCFNRGKVIDLCILGSDIIASVRDDRIYKVVLSREDSEKLRFDCNCGFALGGACEHVVAAMLAANSNQAIQIGFDFDKDQSFEEVSPNIGVELPAGPREDNSNNQKDTLEPEIETSSQIIIDIPIEKPRGRIYLSESDSVLLVEIRFAYYDGAVEFSRNDSCASRLITDEIGKVFRIQRSKARETSIAASLMQYDLVQYQTGIYTPSGDPRIWTLHELQRLAKDGFEIYGQEKLKSANARNVQPKLSLSIQSGDGVFDCDISVSFDGIPAALTSLIMAIRQGSRFVLLSDGTSGILPQEWIDKFAGLFSAIDPELSDKKLRIKNSHMALANILIELADEFKSDEDFRKKIDELKNFKGVEKRQPPADFSAVMRSYQISGYEWFYFLKKYRFGGCLADDMGLGKTVQTLALLLNEKHLGEWQPSLVVAPTSLLFNWQREARKFAPGLNMLLYHGSNRFRYLNVIHMADVVLTSYGTVLRDQEKLKKIKYHYVILDEAQTIKNSASHVSKALKQLLCNYRLALSGTPIENNLGELWSLFSFINPGMLGTYRNFAQNFVKPIEKELNEHTAEVLRKLIFPFVLRRTKEQVAKELPPKNEIILYAEMLPNQRTFYEITRDTYLGRITHSLDVNGGLDGLRIRILEGLLRLRQICCHPLLVDPSFSHESGKFELIEGSIVDMVLGGHRVLVFSQFVKALELLRKRLMEKGIGSEILTGGTRDRGAVVDNFQSGKGAPVFLISLKAGGTGLNLTSADYVIHMDPWWNPSAENQASDRAYRIGQKRTVFIYKVITKESIEERVLALQDRKKQLMQSVLQTDGSFFKQLSKDEILGLFS